MVGVAVFCARSVAAQTVVLAKVSRRETNMRVLSVVFPSLFLVGVVAAQAPSSKPAAPQAPASKAAQAPAAKPAARAPSSRPDGNLVQVMRGIMFPNSNILFDVQTNDPAAEKKLGEAGGGALATYANIYTGWQVPENAAIALAEGVDLILKPGRLCENGKPVPLQKADFRKFAEGLRVVAKAAIKAAQEKNQEKMSDVDNDLAEACLSCHEIYRDKGPAGSLARCPQ